MEAIHQLLGDQPLIALFAIIATGLLLGSLSFKGINLGSSGVLFTALLAGHLGYTIPNETGTLGLVLFVYCVGIGAGGRFFAALAREEGLSDPVPEHCKRESWDADVRSVAGYFVELMNAKTPPDAILTPSDRSVFGIAAALRVFGKKPNKDVALVGYDNYWADCPDLPPAAQKSLLSGRVGWRRNS